MIAERTGLAADDLYPALTAAAVMSARARVHHPCSAPNPADSLGTRRHAHRAGQPVAGS